MKEKNGILPLLTMCMLCILCLSGCGTGTTNKQTKTDSSTVQTKDSTKQNITTTATAQPFGGKICLEANPEIHIYYDENGLVTGVKSDNKNGSDILTSYTDYEGKECRIVINELVSLIGEAGYFKEGASGKKQKIKIEIEEGSYIPSETFIDDITADLKATIAKHKWSVLIDVYKDTEHYDDDDDEYDD